MVRMKTRWYGLRLASKEFKACMGVENRGGMQREQKGRRERERWIGKKKGGKNLKRR